jgi:predicted metal-dependent hydrolase
MLQLPLNLQPGELLIPNPQSPIPVPSQSLAPSPQPLVPALVFARHPRARRYVIRIMDEGTVRVTVPRWGSKREAAAFAAREHAWIAKQLRARAERELRERERRTMNEEPAASNTERQPRPDEQRELLARAKKELPSRLLALAALHGLSVSRVSIRNQRWRWGSCSRKGHICLNWRLVTMPESVRDYVLIHELMHLKRMDHSPKFWKLVAEACPGYQNARRWLRTVSRP